MSRIYDLPDGRKACTQKGTVLCFMLFPRETEGQRLC